MNAESTHGPATTRWQHVLEIFLGIYIGYAGWDLLSSGRASENPLSFALWAVCVSNLGFILFTPTAKSTAVHRPLAGGAVLAAAAALPTGFPADPFWAVLTVPLLIAALGQLWDLSRKTTRPVR